jgi:hypothetical protein
MVRVRNGRISHAVLLIVALAGALRLAAASGDLAIDEIWSWWFVDQMIRRLSDVVALRHDNNHILNTIVIYALGPDVAGIWYRIPAVIASTAAVWLGTRIASRAHAKSGDATAGLLIGASYLLILYGSEARGYAYLVLFAYLSWFCLVRIGANGRWWDAIGFAIGASLGFLSHLTFVHAYAGFLVWTVCQYRSPRFRLLLAAHALPVATAISLYLFFIRGIEIGGGRTTTPSSALLSTVSLIGGGPLSGGLAWTAALLVTALLAWGWARRWKRDRAEAACLVTIIAVAPAIVLLSTGHSLIYPRYFLIPIAFALLVIGDLVAAGWSHRAGRLASLTACGLYLMANGAWTTRLLDHGRGDYSRAILWMAEQSPDRDATVASDHDFRNGMIFHYYAPRLGSVASRLHYVEQPDVPGSGTDWLILHNFEGDAAYPPGIRDRYGNLYQLRETFRHHSPTGFSWWLYRRLPQ